MDLTCGVIPVSQGENESFREQISAMNKELEITKEKLNTLEQAWDNVNTTGKQWREVEAVLRS